MTIRDLLGLVWALFVWIWEWTDAPIVQSTVMGIIGVVVGITNWILDLRIVLLLPILIALGYWAWQRVTHRVYPG